MRFCLEAVLQVLPPKYVAITSDGVHGQVLLPLCLFLGFTLFDRVSWRSLFRCGGCYDVCSYRRLVRETIILLIK